MERISVGCAAHCTRTSPLRSPPEGVDRPVSADGAIWLYLTAAGFGAGVFILLAIWRVSKKIKISLPGGTFRIALILTGLYVGFTLLYVSADNVKNPEIQTTYRRCTPC